VNLFLLRRILAETGDLFDIIKKNHDQLKKKIKNTGSFTFF